MGERKVLNKYYPHEFFDPSTKIPRRRQPKNRQMVVRMMLPMTLRCAACGEYLGRGTKFNSRKEDVAGERYLGAIQVFRFYIRCTRCSAEIAFKTDPKNSDYAVESGATRGAEPWRDAEEAAEERGREGEEEGDTMRALENRSRDARRDMDVASALEEMRSLKSRHAGVTPDRLLETLHRRQQPDATGADSKTTALEDDDEKLIKSITFRNTKDHVKRIEEDDKDFFEECMARSAMASHQQAQKKQQQQQAASRSLVVSKKRRVAVEAKDRARPQTDYCAETTPSKTAASSGETMASNDALQVLCCSYDDDES